MGSRRRRLARRVTTDIATKGGQFDVMTIGVRNPDLGQKGWLEGNQKPDANYDVDDLLPADPLGSVGRWQALRRPVLRRAKARLRCSARIWPTPSARPCRKSRPGSRSASSPRRSTIRPRACTASACAASRAGRQHGALSTMVNTFGGQWFDMTWKPQVDSKPWNDAITFYIDLMKKYGPPGATANSFNENLALFVEGKCGVWVDATSAGGSVSDPKFSKVGDKVAFAKAPTAVTPKGAGWLWSWALAIPGGTQKEEAAQKFINWATSRTSSSSPGRRLDRGANRQPQFDV